MSRRITFRTMIPHLREIDKWPFCDTNWLNEADFRRFELRTKALRHYLLTGRLKEAANIGQCSRAALLDSLTRCLTISEDGRIFGFRALLPYLRTSTYVRYKSLPTGRGQGHHGASGAFDAFLQANPDIHQELDRCIQRGGLRSLQSRNPRAIDVHKTFVMLCRTRVAPDQYPLNSRSKGRRSVERYVRTYLERHLSCIETWYGEDAAQRLRLGTGHKSFALGEAPFDVVGFDAHKLHCIGTVLVPGPAGPQPIAIERLWLNAVIDVGCSRAVLGYSITISTEISAADVERAIKCCGETWKPRPSRIAGMEYREGAGMPVGSVKGLTECRFSKLMMDNAAQHFASRIVHSMRRSMGCAISWGQVGGWWRNTVVERFFGTLENLGFQRLSSSTGSNALDPLKPNSVQEAIDKRITWQDLIDLVDILICNYNATPQRSLGGQTPLNVIRSHIHAESRTFALRTHVPQTAFSPRLGTSIEMRHVRGALQGGRRPYVEVDQVRYSCEALAARFDLVDDVVIVHVDESDMRSVTVYQENGISIGVAHALNPQWRDRSVSRDLLKAINAHVRDAQNNVSEAGDPLDSYAQALMRGVVERQKNRPARISREATELASFAFALGADAEKAGPLKTNRTSHPVRPLPPSMPAPSWDVTPDA